ncbi:hypothetical protein Tco_1521655 [Tanacetum coccineum]
MMCSTNGSLIALTQEYEYELRIENKGYILDDIWEKCEQACGGTLESWYEEGLEEEEKRKCLDGIHYDPFELSVDTYEVKWYSFGNMESFVCVKKMLKEELTIGRVNGSRFKRMIRKEIDTAGRVQRTT